MVAPLDIRFEGLLFARIESVNTAGAYPIFMFSKPYVDDIEDHKYSFDKTAHMNCYDELEVGKYYVIQLDHYYLTKNRRHWLWTSCVEVKTKGMWLDAYNIWKKTKDPFRTLEESGIKAYATPLLRKKKLLKELIEM